MIFDFFSLSFPSSFLFFFSLKLPLYTPLHVYIYHCNLLRTTSFLLPIFYPLTLLPDKLINRLDFWKSIQKKKKKERRKTWKNFLQNRERRRRRHTFPLDCSSTVTKGGERIPEKENQRLDRGRGGSIASPPNSVPFSYILLASVSSTRGVCARVWKG